MRVSCKYAGVCGHLCARDAHVFSLKKLVNLLFRGEINNEILVRVTMSELALRYMFVFIRVECGHCCATLLSSHVRNVQSVPMGIQRDFWKVSVGIVAASAAWLRRHRGFVGIVAASASRRHNRGGGGIDGTAQPSTSVSGDSSTTWSSAAASRT